MRRIAATRLLLLFALVVAGAGCTVNDEGIALIGSRGFEPGEFFTPAHIAADATGFLYVADTDNHRVQKLTGDGEFVDAFGSWGAEPGQFLGLSGLAVGGDGAVYTVEFTTHRVQKFSAAGELLTTWGGNGSGPGEFARPRAIAVAPDGSVYVADTGNHRIQRFTRRRRLARLLGARRSAARRVPRGACRGRGLARQCLGRGRSQPPGAEVHHRRRVHGRVGRAGAQQPARSSSRPAWRWTTATTCTWPTDPTTASR